MIRLRSRLLFAAISLFALYLRRVSQKWHILDVVLCSVDRRAVALRRALEQLVLLDVRVSDIVAGRLLLGSVLGLRLLVGENAVRLQLLGPSLNVNVARLLR